jgi:uncharacterized membrane protein
MVSGKCRQPILLHVFRHGNLPPARPPNSNFRDGIFSAVQASGYLLARKTLEIGAILSANSQPSFPIGTLATIAGLPANLHDWLALFGRTHVIVIHFPIALLLMAALGEVCGRVRGRPAGWTAATLICGAMGAAVSMALGWLLVIYDGYDSSVTLTLHQYLGTATAIFAVATAVLYWKLARERARWWTTSLIILTAAMVAVTGHLGGTLVHGNLFAP